MLAAIASRNLGYLIRHWITGPQACVTAPWSLRLGPGPVFQLWTLWNEASPVLTLLVGFGLMSRRSILAAPSHPSWAASEFSISFQFCFLV